MSEEWHQLLEKLSKDNLALSQEMLTHMKVIRRRLFISELAGWLRLIVVAVPMVLLLLWIPPRLKQLWTDYEENRSDIIGLIQSVNDPAALLRQIAPLFEQKR